MKSLIVIDVQNDFVEGGKLSVAGGKQAASDIADLINNSKQYKFIVATKDCHYKNSENDGHFGLPPDFIDSWPEHCTKGSYGAAFCKPLRYDLFLDTFRKGRGVAAYSGFEGVGVKSNLTLHEYLRGGHDVYDVDICGIAYDYCVKATVLDALKLKYNVTVLRDLCPSIGPKDHIDDALEYEGAKIE